MRAAGVRRWLGGKPRVAGVAKGRTTMESGVKSCGRFTLMRNDEGCNWCLSGASEGRWYWHPESRQWTLHCGATSTEAEATAGLDWALGHEKAGDLNDWQDAPPAHHGTSRV
jgi:hypothetical protein